MPIRDIPPEMWLRVVAFAGPRAARVCLYVSKKLNGVALPTLYRYVVLKDYEATMSFCTSLLSPKNPIPFLRHLCLCTWFLTPRIFRMPGWRGRPQLRSCDGISEPDLELFATVLQRLAKSNALKTIRFEEPPHALFELPDFQPESRLCTLVYRAMTRDMASVHLNLVNVTTLSIDHIPSHVRRLLSDKAVFRALTTFSGSLDPFVVLAQKHSTIKHVTIWTPPSCGSPRQLGPKDIGVLSAALSKVSLESLAVGLEDLAITTSFWTALADTAQDLQSISMTIFPSHLEFFTGFKGYSVRQDL